MSVREEPVRPEPVVATEEAGFAETVDEAGAPPMVAAPEEPKRRRFSFRPEVIFFPALRSKLGAAARPLTIVLILLVGGGGVGYWRLASNSTPAPVTFTPSFKAHVTPFKLLATVPGNNATNVSTASTIILNFSQPVSVPASW